MPFLILLLACSGGETTDSEPEIFYSEPADCGVGAAPGSVEGLARWPYVQSVSTDGAVIAWGGILGSEVGEVAWSRDDGYATTAAASGASLSIADSDGASDTGADDSSSDDAMMLYSAALTDLEPGTEYCYRVAVDGEVLASGLTFRTAPTSERAPVQFFGLGDFGSGTDAQIAVRDQMMAYAAEADLFLTTGDNAYGDGDWDEIHERVFAPYQEIMTSVPMFPVPGNHDYKTDEAAPYLANFFLPEQALRDEDQELYWSIDWGPLHVIGLDSEGAILRTGESEADDMLDWLEQDLAANDRPWTIVSWHKPAYSNHESRDPDLFMLGLVVPILDAHGVDVVLQGHNHFYERLVPMRAGAQSTEGITYVVTGGGGASAYDLSSAPENQAVGVPSNHFVWGEADECSLSIRAIDAEGQTIDAFELTRCS